MNKIFLILLICFSCKAKEEKDYKKMSFDIINNKKEEYISLKNETKTLQNEILVIKDFQKIELQLSVIIFRESEKSFLNIGDNYFQIELEYSIDEKNNSINTDNILLFKKDKEYIILIPTYTEEFTTFQMISYSEKEKFKDLGFKTFGYSEFKKLENNFIDKFRFNIKDSMNNPSIYAEYNNIRIHFSKSFKNENSNIELTKKEKNNILLLRNKQNVISNDNLYSKWQGIYYYSPFDDKDSIGSYYIDIDENNTNYGYSGGEGHFLYKSIELKQNKDTLYIENSSSVLAKLYKKNNQFLVKSDLIIDRKSKNNNTSGVFIFKYAKSANDISDK